MIEDLPESWKAIVATEMEKEYIKKLDHFLEVAYKSKIIYPSRSDVFKAFEFCSLEETKVVILGQDPYHGTNQANGLSFSVPDGIKHPPSLINIFKELEEDCGVPYPVSGNLSNWSKQGVLLLNATLTVEEKKAGSHQGKGWEQFTDAIITGISHYLSGVVFLLWGTYAKKKQNLINTKKHKVLLSGHPSPLSANRGYWFGNKHFSKTNRYLEANQRTPINWQLTSDRLF